MKRGLTLVEILVVIAILAIVASLLVPVFSKGQQAARQSVSAVHLSQIYRAASLYSVAADDRLPFGTDPISRALGVYDPLQLLADSAPHLEDHLLKSGLERQQLCSPTDAGADSPCERYGTSYAFVVSAHLLAIPWTWYSDASHQPFAYEFASFVENDQVAGWVEVSWADGSSRRSRRNLVTTAADEIELELVP